MRKPVFHLLTTDSDLIGLGITASTLFGAATAESPDMRPFGILKWGLDTKAFGLTGSTVLQVWAYDEGNSYVRINNILDRVKLLMTSTSDLVIDQQRLTVADWNGRSEDLYDDIYKCITKYEMFTVVGGKA